MSEHKTTSVRNSDEISFGGERVSHLYQNDCYYAHLSIYRFASQFVQDKVVLDAGSGAGYGAAYLADHGARSVVGLDVSPAAVEFSLKYFQRPNLHFQTMDLEKISGFADRCFDVVFSSNALEHVAHVSSFFRSAWALIRADGALVMAVPPVTSEQSRAANLTNPYHLNIWTPRQWDHVVSQYFTQVQCYRHHCDKPGVALDFGNTPAQTRINEMAFAFEPCSVDELFQFPILTVVLVARGPRIAHELPPLEEPLAFVDDSFTRAFQPSVETLSSERDLEGSCEQVTPLGQRRKARGLWSGVLAMLRRRIAAKSLRGH